MSLLIFDATLPGSVNPRRWRRPARLTVTVLDPGPGTGRRLATGRHASAGVGTGLGLAGMGERLTSVDGTVPAGPAGVGRRVSIDVPASDAPVRVGR